MTKRPPEAVARRHAGRVETGAVTMNDRQPPPHKSDMSTVSSSCISRGAHPYGRPIRELGTVHCGGKRQNHPKLVEASEIAVHHSPMVSAFANGFMHSRMGVLHWHWGMALDLADGSDFCEPIGPRQPQKKTSSHSELDSTGRSPSLSGSGPPARRRLGNLGWHMQQELTECPATSASSKGRAVTPLPSRPPRPMVLPTPRLRWSGPPTIFGPQSMRTATRGFPTRAMACVDRGR
jgi:hypothetical protein